MLKSHHPLNIKGFPQTLGAECRRFKSSRPDQFLSAKTENGSFCVYAEAKKSPARASFQRNAGLFAIAREGCLSGLQRGS